MASIVLLILIILSWPALIVASSYAATRGVPMAVILLFVALDFLFSITVVIALVAH